MSGLEHNDVAFSLSISFYRIVRVIGYNDRSKGARYATSKGHIVTFVKTPATITARLPNKESNLDQKGGMTGSWVDDLP